MPAEYEAALEVALGAAAQNIVVKDRYTAEAAIAYLKQISRPRVTFLPLDRLRAGGPSKSRTTCSRTESASACADLVTFDPAITRGRGVSRARPHPS